MRITEIKPFHFRAFCDSPVVSLNERLTIFYGGNGTGKSSLSESLEWLFYGYTKRRRKGDEYSKNEYKGSYVHNALPVGEASYVEAKVELDNGSEHTIRRTIKLSRAGAPIDQESYLSIDGVEVPDLSSIGLTYSESHCPVIVQHGIQDFIHTRPIDRYRVISEALGLSALISFKDTLEKVKKQRRNNPAAEAIKAKRTISQLIGKLNSLELVAIASRWQSETYSVDDDYLAILEKARELCESKADTIEVAIVDARNRQAVEINKVFDITPYKPNINLDATFEQVRGLVVQLQQKDIEFKTAAAAYAGASASKYQAAQLAFWRQGLSLRQSDDQIECPFCEEATVTQEKVKTLQHRLQSDEQLDKTRTAFWQTTSQYIASLTQLELKLPSLEIRIISEIDLATLEKLIETDQVRLQACVAENRKSGQSVSNLRDILTKSKDAISALKTSITLPEKVSEAVATVAEIASNINQASMAAIESLRLYNETFMAFRPVLEKELSDEQTVARYTHLIDILSNHSDVHLLAQIKAFDNEIIETQRLVDEQVLSEQRAALSSREQNILTWYGLLSPNQDVRFCGLEPGRNEFNLKAEAFGRTMNAAASLSQSQLNCLGLSIYIPSVSSADSPFKFILFDDPVQAMDDDHHESFILNVVPELMNTHSFQVIVLTHLKDTADRLRENYYTGNFIYYRFENLQATGPIIVEHIVLTDDMKKIRLLAQGNDDNRKLAIDRIRVLCEDIMREAYLRHVGSRMPVGHVTATSMLPHFVRIPAVLPDILTTIQDTIAWSNPAHHTPPGYVIPPTAQINPQIERLQRVINALNLR